jgi:hypothetical protein
VDFVNGLRVHHKRDGEDDFDSVKVDWVRRLLIHLHEACAAFVGFIEDSNALLKLEKSGRVDLPKLALGGTQASEECDFGFFLEQLKRAAAEQLGFGVELLVDF